MLHGTWLTPHWNGGLWLEKPPLLLWLIALTFRLFGVSEFAARLPSALSGIAITAFLHHWLAARAQPLAAWLSTLILLATFGFLHICHAGETDTLLALGAIIAVIGLTQVEELDLLAWPLFFAGCALALMTKGAAAVTLPITAILCALAGRWRSRHFGPAFLLGLAIFLALALPWHLLMLHRFGSAFLDQYLNLHVLTRATQQIEGHHTSWLFYFKVLLVSAPPFCLLYPMAIFQGLKRSHLRPWAIFTLTTIAFFTVIQTRLPHYIAPAYPALALLTAVYAADWLQPRLRVRPRSWHLRAAAGLAFIWTASILLTHSTLKSLHSASLAGPGLLDNRDADALLKSAPLPPGPGPLLYLRDGHPQSIASVVFYARRPIQQVTLGPDSTPRNLYTWNPMPLDAAVTAQPTLILLDTSLIPALPPNLVLTPIRSTPHQTLATIFHTPR